MTLDELVECYKIDRVIKNYEHPIAEDLPTPTSANLIVRIIEEHKAAEGLDDFQVQFYHWGEKDERLNVEKLADYTRTDDELRDEVVKRQRHEAEKSAEEEYNRKWQYQQYLWLKSKFEPPAAEEQGGQNVVD